MRKSTLIGALSLVIVVWLGHLDELLAHVHLDGPVDDRDQEPEARLAHHRLVGLAQAEHDHLLVLLHDPHRQVQGHQHDDDHEREGREGDGELHGVLLG